MTFCWFRLCLSNNIFWTSSKYSIAGIQMGFIVEDIFQEQSKRKLYPMQTEVVPKGYPTTPNQNKADCVKIQTAISKWYSPILGISVLWLVLDNHDRANSSNAVSHWLGTNLETALYDMIVAVLWQQPWRIRLKLTSSKPQHNTVWPVSKILWTYYPVKPTYNMFLLHNIT